MPQLSHFSSLFNFHIQNTIKRKQGLNIYVTLDVLTIKMYVSESCHISTARGRTHHQARMEKDK